MFNRTRGTPVTKPKSSIARLMRTVPCALDFRKVAMEMTPSNQHNLFPSVWKYLASLPRGIDSYPECKVRGSSVRAFLEEFPQHNPDFLESLRVLPEAIQNLFDAPASNSAWVPEVLFNCLLLTLVDHKHLDTAGYERLNLEVCRRFYQSVVIKIVLTFTSRENAVEAAGPRWETQHVGSRIAAEFVGPDLVQTRLQFPKNLWNEVLLRGLNSTLLAVLELVDPKNLHMKLTSFSSTEAVFESWWTHG